jgi:hypothetical protein
MAVGQDRVSAGAGIVGRTLARERLRGRLKAIANTRIIELVVIELVVIELVVICNQHLTLNTISNDPCC